MCSKNAISTLLWNPCRLLFGFVDFYSCFLTKYDAAVRLSKLGLPRGFKLNWAHSFNIMQNFVSPNTWFFIHFWLCFVDFYYFVDFYSSWWLDQTTIPVAGFVFCINCGFVFALIVVLWILGDCHNKWLLLRQQLSQLHLL